MQEGTVLLLLDSHSLSVKSGVGSMKTLVVDEPRTDEYLKQGLGEVGVAVDVCYDGSDGLPRALTDAYDLIILEVPLPGIDGGHARPRPGARPTPAVSLHGNCRTAVRRYARPRCPS